MAKKTKKGQSTAKKAAAEKHPAKKTSAKKATPAKKAGASEKNKKLVRKALKECMTLAGYKKFAPNEKPGTYGMETSAWKAILECVCEKIGVSITPTLLKDTKGYTFSKTVGTLAGKMG